MPAFVVKVTLKDRDLLPPITAVAPDEEAAVVLVRACLSADPLDKVECKGLRDEVMKAAFGDQPSGAIVIRRDWTWHSDSAVPKDGIEGARPMGTAPRDREIMIFGRRAIAAPKEWILGRSVGSMGWCAGPDGALIQIIDASLWKNA